MYSVPFHISLQYIIDANYEELYDKVKVGFKKHVKPPGHQTNFQ